MAVRGWDSKSFILIQYSISDGVLKPTADCTPRLRSLLIYRVKFCITVLNLTALGMDYLYASALDPVNRMFYSASSGQPGILLQQVNLNTPT